jgi:hypothetical protein
MESFLSEISKPIITVHSITCRNEKANKKGDFQKKPPFLFRGSQFRALRFGKPFSVSAYKDPSGKNPLGTDKAKLPFFPRWSWNGGN